MKMKAIVCVDKNWAIGLNDKLLFDIKEDLLHFKKLTINKVCVMGYNTYKSLPNGALKNRTNVVLTSKQISIDGAVVCNNVKELDSFLKNYDSNDVFVIGGQQIYKLLLSHCQEAIVTKIEQEKNANKFFPNLDNLKNWTLKQKAELKNEDNLPASILIYKNIDVKKALC